MYRGDQARKTNLVQHGFRLPSALDNRPLRSEEFDQRRRQVVFVSATPGDRELEVSGGVDAEQVIRPTGLLDPVLEMRPATGQVDDLLTEIKAVVRAQGQGAGDLSHEAHGGEPDRVLPRPRTPACAISTADIDTLERHAIIRSLRLDEFDVLVGINLLREGLDIPEVELVAILDADKEGFLRSKRSLIQTIGRASRNVNGRRSCSTPTARRTR